MCVEICQYQFSSVQLTHFLKFHWFFPFFWIIFVIFEFTPTFPSSVFSTFPKISHPGHVKYWHNRFAWNISPRLCQLQNIEDFEKKSLVVKKFKLLIWNFYRICWEFLSFSSPQSQNFQTRSFWKKVRKKNFYFWYFGLLNTIFKLSHPLENQNPPSIPVFCFLQMTNSVLSFTLSSPIKPSKIDNSFPNVSFLSFSPPSSLHTLFPFDFSNVYIYRGVESITVSILHFRLRL